MNCKWLMALFFLLAPAAWAEPALDAGQQRVSAAIDTWRSCIRQELQLQIDSIASAAFIAEATLSLCDAPFWQLQQLMLSDMLARDTQASEDKIVQLVGDSLRDVKDNHRAKIISLVLKHRAR
ncbi:hypothetical protein ABHF33_12040 [Chitinibacter sp. FCG-7]|uniref:Uncharacterized protein n=1 Tax=Chitinibacter mangrovi TaxID=3153927 RepID=A0AAU7F869_9NEIS